MGDSADRHVERFLKALMELQRKYGTDRLNAKSNRQDEVRALVEKFVARSEQDAD